MITKYLVKNESLDLKLCSIIVWNINENKKLKKNENEKSVSCI